MAGIADRMSGMASGKHSGGGITGAMSRESSMATEPASEEDAGGPAGHMKAMHDEMGGKHMHVHSHEGGTTTHQVGEDGNVEGPHDHENIEALKEHIDKFFNEEAREPSDDDPGSEGLM